MSVRVSRKRADERFDLTPLGGHLAGVREALVERVAVDAELDELVGDAIALGHEVGAQRGVRRAGHARDSTPGSRPSGPSECLRPGRAQRAPTLRAGLTAKARGWAVS